MKSFYLGLIFAIGTGLIATGCEPIKKEPEVTGNSPLTNSSNGESSASKGAGEASNSVSKAAISPAELENRKVQFEQMQKSLHAVAGIETSKKGPEFDYKFVLPSDDWEKTSHAGGDRKSSVWLFTAKKSGLKILVSCAGVKEDPAFANSALQVYEASKKRQPEVTREWKIGNFTLRRSFIGFVDDRHGEVTVSAFSPICTLEFNIAGASIDRDELIKFADDEISRFITKNPNGGFPAK